MWKNQSTRLQSGVDFATQDMEQEALFESQLLPLVISNHSWTKTCQAFSLHVFWSEFSCKQARLTCLRSSCDFCFPDPNYRPTTSQHVSTGFCTTKICLSTTIRLDPCLPIMLGKEYLVAAPVHHWTSNSRVFSENWSKHLVFVIGNFCWFDLEKCPPKKRTTNIQNIQPPKSTMPDVDVTRCGPFGFSFSVTYGFQTLILTL